MESFDHPVTIAAFQAGDLPILLGFIAGLQDFERSLVPDYKPGHEIAQDYAAYLLRTVEARGGLILIARVQGQAAGFGCVWPAVDNDPLLREGARAHAYISDLFVDARWRGRGIARHVLEGLTSAMKAKGCSRIQLRVKASNHAAITCYERDGFRPYETVFQKQIP